MEKETVLSLASRQPSSASGRRWRRTGKGSRIGRGGCRANALCRRRIGRLWISVVLLVAGWTGAVQACADDNPSAGQGSDDQLKQLSLAELGNVQVTGVSKEPEQVWRTAAAIFVLTQEDIRRSGANSVPEVLRLVPGVQVAQVDSDHWSISIRGFAGQFSKSLLVLIDGRSVYTPLFSGVYWDVQNLLLEDVERIEVIRGPGGTIWGANAVNGVINIITKSAKNTQGALVSAGGGNVDQGTGAARFGGTVGKDFSFRIYGMGFVDGPEFHSDANGFDDWRIGQMGFRTDWTAGVRDSFTVQGDIYRGETGERVDLASFTPPAELSPDDRAYVSGGNLVARWQHESGTGSDTQIQLYFDRTIFQDLELGETRNTFDLDYVHHERPHKGHKLTWGAGARISPSNFIQTSPGVSFLPNKQTDTIYSGFVQDEISFFHDRLTLTAGTKLEHNNFSGFEYQPTARLLWAPTDHQSFWLAFTRAVRTPSRLDQDVQFSIFVENTPTAPVYFNIAGDPNFSAERLVGYEAGFRRTISRHVYLDFTAFYNNYSDLQGYGPLSLVLVNTPAPPHAVILVPYANVIEGNTAGAEIATDYRIASWWQIRGSYSFLHMGLRDAPGFTDVGNLLSLYEGSSPRHVVVFQSQFNLPKRFELDQTLRYSSALPDQLVKGYVTADIRLGWHLAEHLEFSAVGQNLLQPSHVEFGGDPGPLVGIKRGAYAKLVWRK